MPSACSTGGALVKKNAGDRRPPPDKSLGQHFLANAGVVAKIADWIEEWKSPAHNLLEIGPGPGVLTAELLRRFDKLTVVEIDPRMVEHLGERFAPEVAAQKLHIVHADATTIKDPRSLGLPDDQPLFVLGNFPYNVGTRILFHFLESFRSADKFCVMLQREVVQRLKARCGDPDFGIPSVKCELLGDDFSSFWVAPGSFQPPPKVESGVLRFRRKIHEMGSPESEVLAKPLDYTNFFAAVNRAFSKRRKMLKASFPALKDLSEGKLRPEELSLEQWLSLYFSQKLQ